MSNRYYHAILPTISHTVTDAYHLVTTILTVIPVPLTTEIENYNRSVIKRHLMNNCSQQFNQLLLDIQTSLCQLSTLLNGYYDTIDNEQLQLLDCLLTNRIPTCWYCPLKLPANVDLTGYLEILRRVAECMTEYLLQPSTHHNRIDITFIPNIAGLLEEYKLYYCKSNNVHAEDISLLCQVSYCINQITSELILYY